MDHLYNQFITFLSQCHVLNVQDRSQLEERVPFMTSDQVEQLFHTLQSMEKDFLQGEKELEQHDSDLYLQKSLLRAQISDLKTKMAQTSVHGAKIAAEQLLSEI